MALRPLVLAAALGATALVGGCTQGESAGFSASEDGASTSGPPMSDASISQAVARGAAYLQGQMPSIDVGSAMVLDYLHRNWGIEGLSDFRSYATERVLDGPMEGEDPLWSRMAIPDSDRHLDTSIAQNPTAIVLSAALHCDNHPLDHEELTQLEDLLVGGGYPTSHAALALGWMDELGCSYPPEMRDLAIDLMARELAHGADGPLTDLAVEQSAFLLYLGAADRVPAGWAQRVLEAQQPDGGWGEEAGATDWHMTLLAVWALEALGGPGQGLPMLLAASHEP